MLELQALIGDEVGKVRREIAEAQDKFILNFFGSYKNTVALGPYFVLETKEPVTDFDFTGDIYQTSYSLTVEFCLRRRTPEELENAGITKSFYEALAEVIT